MEAKTTSFHTLYLITTDGEAYNSSYLKSYLQDMPWADEFQRADGRFAIRYDEVSREKWGEFLVYGVRLAEPVLCGEKEINGAVGLVSIEEIADQMQMCIRDRISSRRSPPDTILPYSALLSPSFSIQSSFSSGIS